MQGETTYDDFVLPYLFWILYAGDAGVAAYNGLILSDRLAPGDEPVNLVDGIVDAVQRTFVGYLSFMLFLVVRLIE